MTWLAIPNVSEGRDARRVAAMKAAIESGGARVLDIHTDGVHNRGVFTATADPKELPTAMASLAMACEYIDLTHHRGVHPRIGRLDVCPIVPLDESMRAAVAIAHETGEAIHSRTGLPIYFYGAAATRSSTRDLPYIRKGGLQVLVKRALTDLRPDIGGTDIELRAGVVCVGARDPLIAFNVWVRCDQRTAGEIARRIRTSGGGLPGVRALGLKIDDKPTSQVSINLIDPSTTGIDVVFAQVSVEARRAGCHVIGTEIVGLVPDRYRPDPNAKAARLLIAPGRSVEAAAS